MDQDIKPFEGQSFEVTTRSGRVFVMRELSGIEGIKATSLVPEGAKSETELYYRVALSLQSVDGKRFQEVGDSRLVMQGRIEGRLRAVSSSELDDLVRLYFKNTIVSATELPKESPPTAD